MRRAIGEICRRVWGERVSGKIEGWGNSANREKERTERVENYRGVTLMPIAYKIYAMVLAERLRGKMKEKGVLPEGQARFRKGRRVIDNIYTLTMWWRELLTIFIP